MARCLPTVGSHSETSLPVSDTTWGVPSDRLLGPWPYVGSPTVVPDSVALGQLSKTLGGLAFEPLDHNGLNAPYRVGNETSSMGLGRLSLSWVQEEPPSLCTEREGDQGSP